MACDKEDIKRYDRERAAIEFNGNSYTYSFKQTSQTTDTINIPFDLVGYPENWVRNAEFMIITDSTTATSNEYRILDAILKPGEYSGNLRIEVKNEVGDDFQDVRIYFEIAQGKDFIPGMDTKKNCFLYLTNQLARPASWDNWVERYRLGNYSTAYYQFIIEVTGETEFPIRSVIPGYNNNETWSTAYTEAFIANLKKELKARNEREHSPLLHDDGVAKDKEVVIGKYYQN
jgi:hypothetical protein